MRAAKTAIPAKAPATIPMINPAPGPLLDVSEGDALAAALFKVGVAAVGVTKATDVDGVIELVVVGEVDVLVGVELLVVRVDVEVEEEEDELDVVEE